LVNVPANLLKRKLFIWQGEWLAMAEPALVGFDFAGEDEGRVNRKARH
jgi:hypothetical protein